MRIDIYDFTPDNIEYLLIGYKDDFVFYAITNDTEAVNEVFRNDAPINTAAILLPILLKGIVQYRPIIHYTTIGRLIQSIERGRGDSYLKTSIEL